MVNIYALKLKWHAFRSLESFWWYVEGCGVEGGKRENKASPWGGDRSHPAFPFPGCSLPLPSELGNFFERTLP